MASPRRNSVFRAAALERLASPEQLDERMRVVSPRAWLALAAVGALLLALVLWSCLGRITVEVRAPGRFAPADAGVTASRTAVVTVGPRDVRRIRPGMPARLLPVTYSTSEDGFIHGTVTAIGAPRAVDATAAQPAGGASFDVRIAISSAGAPPNISCTASIVVAEQRPIALVLPSIAGLVGR